MTCQSVTSHSPSSSSDPGLVVHMSHGVFHSHLIDAHEFSLFSRTVTGWNAIPDSIRYKQSINAFNKVLHKLPYTPADYCRATSQTLSSNECSVFTRHWISITEGWWETSLSFADGWYYAGSLPIMHGSARHQSNAMMWVTSDWKSWDTCLNTSVLTVLISSWS